MAARRGRGPEHGDRESWVIAFWRKPALRRDGETEKGPHRSATPSESKMNVTAQTTTMQPQRLEEGVVNFTPARANHILATCRYERQRPIDKLHVATLLEHMKRGSWRERVQIAFARVNGRWILIDGYHRLTAQAQSGRDIVWTVTIYDAASEAEVDTLYYKFDTNLRQRSANNIAGAVRLADRAGISKTMASNLQRAAKVIMSDMRVGTGSLTQEQIIQLRMADAVLEACHAYAAQAAMAEELFSAAPALLRAKIKSGGFLAVILVTLRHQEKFARAFWGGLAENDGLKKGDPRRTLFMALTDRSFNTGNMQQSVIVPAKAWNAFFDQQPLQMIRVTAGQTIKIAGTPFKATA
jgi:hypothetical protein